MTNDQGPNLRQPAKRRVFRQRSTMSRLFHRTSWACYYNSASQASGQAGEVGIQDSINSQELSHHPPLLHLSTASSLRRHHTHSPKKGSWPSCFRRLSTTGWPKVMLGTKCLQDKQDLTLNTFPLQCLYLSWQGQYGELSRIAIFFNLIINIININTKNIWKNGWFYKTVSPWYFKKPLFQIRIYNDCCVISNPWLAEMGRWQKSRISKLYDLSKAHNNSLRSWYPFQELLLSQEPCGYF